MSRALGLKGELAVKCFDEQSTVLLTVQRVHLRRATTASQPAIDSVHTLSSSRAATAKELAMVLTGVTTREAAEQLIGTTVSVFREDLEAPEPGSFFSGDLVGLKALDPTGGILGVVETVLNTGPVPNLVIRCGAEEVLVPFAEEFVIDINMARASVTVRLPVYE